nr:hypothetical protein TGBR9_277930B [Toxoplasma gondii TgCATBr9]
MWRLSLSNASSETFEDIGYRLFSKGLAEKVHFLQTSLSAAGKTRSDAVDRQRRANLGGQVDGGKPRRKVSACFRKRQKFSSFQVRRSVQLRDAFSVQLRDAFNQMFDAVAMDKKRTVEQINQRAKLASAIAAELKCAQKVDAYTSPACEDPEALLKVTEEDVLSELGFVPSWLSSGENNEEGKEEDSNACIDEASARALQQMMDGQLNSKRDMNVLEIKLEK